MQARVEIKGLEQAMRAMRSAFPADPKKQVSILNAAMRAAARPTIVSKAKQFALRGDGSGALSEAITVRAMSAAKRRRLNTSAGVEVVPARFNRKALALYISHYYTREGLSAPAAIFRFGIRHGHLIEFGTAKITAKPFMWPALTAGRSAYEALFARQIETVTQRRVRQARRR
jgi:hypothetical protein